MWTFQSSRRKGVFFLAVQDSSIGDLVSQWVSHLLISEQSRAEQSRAEQSRAEQRRAEKRRAEQSRADSDLDLGLG